MKNKNKFFDIVYEDDDFLVINKQAGVYSIDPRHSTPDPVLPELLSRICKEIYIVHRLDRETSGLIIYAKNAESHKILSQQFLDNKIEKIYLAFVDGQMDFDGTHLIDVPIFIEPGKAKVRIDPKGKDSKTKIRIVERYSNYTLLEAKLITGRTHQIRIHLQYIGHPLIVDKLYGKREEFFLSEIKHKYRTGKYSEELPLITRQTLHSHRIKLLKPSDGKAIEFEAPLPKDLNALRNQLQKPIRQ